MLCKVKEPDTGLPCYSMACSEMVPRVFIHTLGTELPMSQFRKQPHQTTIFIFEMLIEVWFRKVRRVISVRNCREFVFTGSLHRRRFFSSEASDQSSGAAALQFPSGSGGTFLLHPRLWIRPRNPGLDAQNLLQWALMSLNCVPTCPGLAVKRTFCSPQCHPLRPSVQSRAAVIERALSRGSQAGTVPWHGCCRKK